MDFVITSQTTAESDQLDVRLKIYLNSFTPQIEYQSAVTTFVV